MDKLKLKRCLFVGVFAMLSAWPVGLSAQQYRVSACDWMMLKRQKLGEFQLANQWYQSHHQARQPDELPPRRSCPPKMR